MPVKLKDIADKTGFSINTVSRVVNGKSDVAEPTRKIIAAAAEELGYVPNSAASMLRTGKSNTLALILDDLINPHFSIIADEISLYVAELHYNLIIYTSNGNAAKERKAILSACGNNIAGIILCPTQDSRENLEFIRNKKIPFVLLERVFDHSKNDSYVAYDETRIGFVAAEHLLLRGHKRILTVMPEESTFAYSQRLTGIMMAYQSYGAMFDTGNVCTLSLNIRSQSEEIKKILSAKRDHTAIIAHNDMIALHILSNLTEEVPIIGFGNIQKKIPFQSGLLSIDTAGQNISVCCVDALLRLIQNPDELQQHILSVSLIKKD